MIKKFCTNFVPGEFLCNAFCNNTNTLNYSASKMSNLIPLNTEEHAISQKLRDAHPLPPWDP